MTRRLSEQQRSLAASEQRFRELFASSPTPLLELDRELGLRDANPAAAAFLGAEPTRATGRRLGDFLVEDSAVASAAGIASSARSRLEGVVEGRWRMPGGELAEVELHFRPAGEGVSEGTIVAIHDLTDRVRRLGQRWQRTFDAMIDGVALVEPDGAVELANRALAPHLPVLAKELAARGAEEGSWRTTSVDRLLECNLSRSPGSSRGVLVVRDVTEAVNAEARLRESEKMQAVGTLASGVAHDFNNLLAAVRLHLRLIEAEPERTAEAVAAISDLAEQGSEVVGELLLFARSDDSVAPQTFDLAALVADQAPVLRHLLPDDVALEVDVSGGVVPVSGNPVALRRLVLNLVVNARDAVAESGGTVAISVARRSGRALLEVADSGPGVAEEIRDRLFEPFFTLRRRGRGAGLGLAVVYAIASAHGGEVELVSRPGEGARFEVRLPPGRIEDLNGADKGDRSGHDNARRVVVVEPDGRTAAALMEELAGAGYDVRHAPDTVSAGRVADGWAPFAVVMRSGDAAAVRWSAKLDAVSIVFDPGEAPPIATRLVAMLDTRWREQRQR
jgi:PAS domain S-box-containing protein